VSCRVERSNHEHHARAAGIPRRRNGVHGDRRSAEDHHPRALHRARDRERHRPRGARDRLRRRTPTPQGAARRGDPGRDLHRPSAQRPRRRGAAVPGTHGPRGPRLPAIHRRVVGHGATGWSDEAFTGISGHPGLRALTSFLITPRLWTG